jgi:hypothetical protein
MRVRRGEELRKAMEMQLPNLPPPPTTGPPNISEGVESQFEEESAKQEDQKSGQNEQEAAVDAHQEQQTSAIEAVECVLRMDFSAQTVGTWCQLPREYLSVFGVV